jgi:hypothetical protein
MGRLFRNGRRSSSMVCRAIRISTVVSWVSGYRFLISINRKRSSKPSSNRDHDLLLLHSVVKVALHFLVYSSPSLLIVHYQFQDFFIFGSLYSLRRRELQTTDTDLDRLVRRGFNAEVHTCSITHESAIASDAHTGERRTCPAG